ncbi:Rieske (2Fe-2S) protein [Pusillimonas sp.]|uniref:Rieske (2Fe-2S) protein n=1 Tax=Pusillimonas sp. TaxID=3040095 RepID=UPI0029B540F2|nr:Rieske 2Fe-2S domain-containing protein [Pusillimonas sp.]MDX3893434.1 Rieske 2Fe-2S domain-containing protein [Pusillimonas sp.]
MNAHIQAQTELQLVCAEQDVPRDGAVATYLIGGRQIAVARKSTTDDTIVAFDSQCPHMDAPFRFGRVVDGEVICPWHFFRFDTTTGETSCCDKSSMKLKTYQVQVLDGKVYIHA